MLGLRRALRVGGLALSRQRIGASLIVRAQSTDSDHLVVEYLQDELKGEFFLTERRDALRVLVVDLTTLLHVLSLLNCL